MLFGMEILGGTVPFAGGFPGENTPFPPIGWEELCPVAAIWGNQAVTASSWQNVNRVASDWNTQAMATSGWQDVTKVTSDWEETETTEQPFTRCNDGT